MTTYHFLVRSLSQQLNKALTLGTKRHPFGRHHGIYSIGKPWTSEHHQKSHLMPSNMSFLLKSRTLSHLTQEIGSPSPQGFLHYECESYLKQPLPPPQLKVVVAYRTSNHGLAIQSGQQSTIPNSSNQRLRQLCYDRGCDK